MQLCENLLTDIPLGAGARRPCASRRPLRAALAVLFLGASASALAARPAAAVELVSTKLTGFNGGAASNGVAVNADGSIVAFYSDASNLVAGDTNATRDVFVRDRSAQKTERVSVSSAGAQANGASQPSGGAPAMSADGNTVAFYSAATNLVAQDTNGQTDVFVRVRNSGTTELISAATDGTPGNGPSVAPSISADGNFVAFQSRASNLISGDTNNAADIFVRDRRNQTTERVCNGVQGNRFSYSPSISADGSIVAFVSAADNLVPGDANGRLDIFVCDRTTGTIELVSVSSSGAHGDGDSILPALSGDGHLVAFKSLADNFVPNDNNGVVDVFAYNRDTKTIERISVDLSGGDANDFSFPPSVSGDGRFVVFGSFATNLVPNDSNSSADVFVRDRQIGITKLVDVNDQGVEADGGTVDVPPSISQDGTQIGFVSFASNLVDGDTNQAVDVFATLNPFYGAEMCPDGTCPDGQVCVEGTCVVPRATATLTPIRSRTSTGTPTNIRPTFTPTAGTPAPTPTATPPSAASATRTRTATSRPTATATPKVTASAAPTSGTGTPPLLGTPTATPTASSTRTGTATGATTAAATPSSTATAAATRTTPSPTLTAAPTTVLTASTTRTTTASPALTTAATPSSTATAAVTRTPPSPTVIATATIVSTASTTRTTTASPALTTAATPSSTATAAATRTTPSPTLTAAPTTVVTASTTRTTTASPGPTTTATRVVTATGSQTVTATPAIPTVTPTRASTASSTATGAAVGTATPTVTPALTALASRTATTAVPTGAASPTAAPTGTPQRACTGDCDGVNGVDLRELSLCLKIVNGSLPLDACPACDPDGNGPDLLDLVHALKNATEGGCN